MVTGIEAAGALKLGFQLTNATTQTNSTLKSFIDKDVNLGAVYNSIQEMMKQRKIISSSEAFKLAVEEKADPVISPLMEALLGVYEKPAGMVYVMHAKPGLGKTFAARALLENFYVFSDQNLKGFMVTGTDLDEDYFSSLASLLGAQNVQGWMHGLLLALDAPKDEQPNILILDGFNSGGENNININFVKKLYGEINIDKNLFVVVVTQDESVADELCRLNGGVRIAPLPNTFTGPATSPKWLGMEWSRELLIELTKWHFPECEEEKMKFIKDGMSPGEVKKEVQLSFRKVEKPQSPRRKSRSTED
jgi:hypothetical protein